MHRKIEENKSIKNNNKKETEAEDKRAFFITAATVKYRDFPYDFTQILTSIENCNTFYHHSVKSFEPVHNYTKEIYLWRWSSRAHTVCLCWR